MSHLLRRSAHLPDHQLYARHYHHNHRIRLLKEEAGRARKSRASIMTITPEDVEAEHNAALASLTDVQRRAIHRMQQAKQQSHFNNRFPTDNLKTMFETEAASRSERRAAA